MEWKVVRKGAPASTMDGQGLGAFRGGSSVTVIAPTATELQGSVGFRSQNAEDLLQIDYQAILEVFDGIFFVFTAIIIQGFANLTYQQHLMSCIVRILGFAY